MIPAPEAGRAGRGAGGGRGTGGRPRPAAFLDRDGTVIAEREYLAEPARVELVPGAAAALGRLQDAGYALVIITNQSGIARGFYGEEDFRAVQARIEELLREEGVHLDGTYFCPHDPEVTGPCDCRKPATGLYRRAAGELRIDLERSACIGDRVKDVLPARELGGAAILVRTGYGGQEEAGAPADVVVVEDLAAAADWVLEHGGE